MISSSAMVPRSEGVTHTGASLTATTSTEKDARATAPSGERASTTKKYSVVCGSAGAVPEMRPVSAFRAVTPGSSPCTTS